VVFLKNQEIGGFFDRCRISLEDIKRGLTNDVRNNRLVKRVIGLPGETLQIRNGSVFIDGKELEEPYVKNFTYPNSLDGAYQIPEDQYFMMGDNRIWSSDSRDFGPIPITSIEGKASSIVWPPTKWTSLGAGYSDSN